MNTSQTTLDSEQVIMISGSYTRTQLLLNDLVLVKLLIFSEEFTGSFGIISLHRRDLEAHFSFSEVLKAIKTMTSIPVRLLELTDLSNIFDGVPLYSSIHHIDNEIYFELNQAIAPHHWKGILRGTKLAFAQ
jgi:hypothetical protein